MHSEIEEFKIEQQRLAFDPTSDISTRPIKVFIQDSYDNPLPTRFVRVNDIEQADAVLTGSPRSGGKRIPVGEAGMATYLAERQGVIDTIVERRLPLLVPNPDVELPFDGKDFGLGYQTIGSGVLADECERRWADGGVQGTYILRTGKPSPLYYDHVKASINHHLIGKEWDALELQRLADGGEPLVEEFPGLARAQYIAQHSRVLTPTVEDPFRSVPRQMFNPARTVMVGDSFVTDLRGGVEAGFRTVGVVNDKSNLGIMLKRNEEGFRAQLADDRTKPSVVVQTIGGQ
jgi:ribonucleotide monophosphatase NagD (HAD superfamily)